MPAEPVKPNTALKLYRIARDQPVALFEIAGDDSVRLPKARPLTPAEIRQLIDDLLQRLPAADRHDFELKVRTEDMI